jgi:hypothetical protein
VFQKTMLAARTARKAPIFLIVIFPIGFVVLPNVYLYFPRRISTFDAAGELSFRPVKSLVIDNVYSDKSVAGCHSQAGPGQAVAHNRDIHFIFVMDFFVKGGNFCPGCLRTSGKVNSPPVGARPAAIAQHDNEIS